MDTRVTYFVILYALLSYNYLHFAASEQCNAPLPEAKSCSTSSTCLGPQDEPVSVPASATTTATTTTTSSETLRTTADNATTDSPNAFDFGIIESPFEQFGNGTDRIVGGNAVNISEVPYQASLQRSGSHICGACIISNLFLTTAGHCNAANVSALRVRVGSSMRTRYGLLLPVAEMISHPNYTKGKPDFDYCVIRLKSVLVFTPFIQPIAMIKQDEELDPDSYITVQGWGLTQENGTISLPLMQITVPVVSASVCRSVYGSTITNRMFCAGDFSGKMDSCQGDSGGPAVCEGVLVGIVSWGFGCARAGYPGVYSKIADQRNWITRVTGVEEFS